MKKINKQKQGKTNRRHGREFEKLVREDLESQECLVFKNMNTIIDNNFVQAKAKFNPFTKRVMCMSTGFPDYLVIKSEGNSKVGVLFSVRFVEVKLNKYLDKLEKEKIKWIKNNLHIPVFVASKKDKEIKYEEVKSEGDHQKV